MTKPILSHFLWALAAGGAFLLGYLVAGGSHAARAGAKPVPLLANALPDSAHAGADFRERASSLMDAPAALTLEQARIRTFELLGEPNRFERLRQLCELFRSVTAENWRGVLDAFARQALTTGGLHREESRMMLERVGEVVGKMAIEETLGSAARADQERIPFLLTGWAASDPKAALAWLGAQPPERQNLLASHLVNGLARSDADAALTFLSVHQPELKDRLMPRIVDEVIQRGGVHAGEELFALIRHRPEMYEVKGTLFYQLAMRQIERARLRGEPAFVLDWADRYLGPGLMGHGAVRDIVTFAAQEDAPGTMKWIEARTGRWTPTQEASIFPAIAQAMQQQAPEQFAAWMNANREHPQREAMADAVARRLVQSGNLQEARQWGEAISDPAKRASLEQTLKGMEERLNRAKAP